VNVLRASFNFNLALFQFSETSDRDLLELLTMFVHHICREAPLPTRASLAVARHQRNGVRDNCASPGDSTKCSVSVESDRARTATKNYDDLPNGRASGSDDARAR
jgi:hypothetical protein